MALQKDPTRFNVRGGPELFFRQLISGGAGTAFTSLGYIKNLQLLLTPEMLDGVAADGNVFTSIRVSTKGEMKATLQQTDAETFNFLMGTDGKFYEFFYPVLMENGDTQEINFFARIAEGIDASFQPGERTLPLNAIIIKPKAAYTRAPTDYNNSTAKYIVMIQNAVAKGVPTDTVGTVYTAVIA